ncbi:MAG: 2-oxoglutarate dehydrogenase E1 component [Flavobacteriales bacterium]|nr:2-oxoglutarate dehydrogenase E1 component [Flavobacteriales bacterium]
MDKHSFLSNGDVAAFEELYQSYVRDENSVDVSWKEFFQGFEFARKNYGGDEAPEGFGKEFKVINLINGYRQRGHLFTKTNPVRERRSYKPTLDLDNFGLEASDMDTVFQAGSEIGIGPAKLRDIVAHLQQTYCGSIGVEYLYIRDPNVIKWLRERMEPSRNTPLYSKEKKIQILEKLNAAVGFEQFLHTKFVGQKRFSLEGLETFIPALDSVVDIGGDLGIEEFIIGMAHRGRLNVLANIFRKSYQDIFSEFEGNPYDELNFAGDVKYHLGMSSDIETSSGKSVHMSLSANPSHLEAADPVVEGMVRAKIDNKYDGDCKKVMPILIHGDASIAGQGVVYEVIQMSQLDGYKTGGTMHIVLNNQIGFTTNYLDARSSTYCTDVAKTTLSPVFHVNGDDVEAIVFAVQLAMEFRQEFERDVFIDILGYRKHGHNEGDEPKFTQPLLYKAIASHPNPREIYRSKLIEEKTIDDGVVKKMDEDFKSRLQKKLDVVKSKKDKVQVVDHELRGTWASKRSATKEDFETSPGTAVTKRVLTQVGERLFHIPEDIQVFRKVKKLFKDRTQMLKDGKADWAIGELLAYGTLVNEGFRVRLSGQDVERGTFSHRHAVIKHEDSDQEYTPLANISKKQAPFDIYNSLLSEYGVLGFEYGYASVSPDRLVIWEAQFGDFSNETQVILDQFLSAAEDKWMRQNGLVMLLPHGYEGQGAEHSSARLERYLQLCSELNMQIVNCTTPANFFHVLRRQLHRDFCKPLIVFTPKSLLRHPACVSSLDEFSKGGFREVIDDEEVEVEKVKKVIFCCGKIYYEMLVERKKKKVNKIAIVRIEQLYPLAEKQLEAVVKKYSNAESFVWLQEEPENMGAWSHLLRTFKAAPLEVIARPESAAPATGSAKIHQIEQLELYEQALEKSYHREKELTGLLKHFSQQ